MLFDKHEKNDNGDGREKRGCKEVLPLDHVEGRELRDADGNRALRHGGDKHGGNRVLVPGVDEDEDERRHDAGRRHREQHVPERPERGAAVNTRGLLHLRRDGNERAAEKPDGKGLVEGGVYKDEAEQRVVEIEIAHELGYADEKDDGREHLAHDDEAEKRLFRLELHTGHGVGGGNAADKRHKRRAAGNDK